MIIEPHPDVLAHMRKQGWYDLPNVKILEGRWQDFLPSAEMEGFDVVYTDTFSEDYTGWSSYERTYRPKSDFANSSTAGVLQIFATHTRGRLIDIQLFQWAWCDKYVLCVYSPTPI